MSATMTTSAAAGLAGAELDWLPEVRADRRGWFTLQLPAVNVAAHEALGVHDGWKGPTKLVHGPDGLWQRMEFALPGQAPAGAAGLPDPSETGQEQAVREGVRRAAGLMRADPAGCDLLNPLAVAMVREVIQAEGCAVATDEQNNLRLAIGYQSFDGQTRIECGPRRLRLTTVLGDWSNLPPGVESAMLQLAAEANARTRLVRIVWRESTGRRQCEAQVDLTGAPWVAEEHACFAPIARRALQMALAGLAAAVRRLGRELSVLADPANQELAEAFHQRSAAASWWDAL